MKPFFKVLAIAACSTVALGGCSDITFFFAEGDPEDVSSCEFVLDEFDEGGLLCVECNSDSAPQVSESQCGVEISARCNSNFEDPIYGIAVGGWGDGATLVTGTAWIDVDDDGADGDDFLICHEQSAEGIGLEEEGGSKQEYKCTTALKGNGKEAATFEFEIKYDPSEDDCVV